MRSLLTTLPISRVLSLGAHPTCSFPHSSSFAVRQGLNVVIVSLDDKFLAETYQSVSERYAGQKFRKVGVNFAPGVKYMDMVK